MKRTVKLTKGSGKEWRRDRGAGGKKGQLGKWVEGEQEEKCLPPSSMMKSKGTI